MLDGNSPPDYPLESLTEARSGRATIASMTIPYVYLMLGLLVPPRWATSLTYLHVPQVSTIGGTSISHFHRASETCFSWPIKGSMSFNIRPSSLHSHKIAVLPVQG